MNRMDSVEESISSLEESATHEPTSGENTHRICRVCHGSASGMYFGALVCLPCKSFFIRSTKDGEPNFMCVTNQGNCDILLSNRLRCQFCRYQKCLNVGMCRKEKPEVVDVQEGQKLCDVCHDIANGVHFGVPTCEGCKKFFRRGMKEADTYECKLHKDCPINPRNRNTCRYCRYQRCLAVGMSKQAIQMGRPKKEAVHKKRLLQPGSTESTLEAHPSYDMVAQIKREPPEFPQLCVVCGDTSSGVHFSVPACEDCKVFFLYGTHKADQITCQGDGACTTNFRTKTACHFCWYKKCLAVGMKSAGVPQAVYNFPMKVEIQTARNPKRHRSESAVTDLSDLDTCISEEATRHHSTRDFSTGMMPPQSALDDKQDRKMPETTLLWPSDHRESNKVSLRHLLMKTESAFSATEPSGGIDSMTNSQPVKNQPTSSLSQLHSIQSVGRDQSNCKPSTNWKTERFLHFQENDTDDPFSVKATSKTHENSMDDQPKVFDRVHMQKSKPDVGYVNELQLHVVNEFYDKTIGQNHAGIRTSSPEESDLCKTENSLSGTPAASSESSCTTTELLQSADDNSDVTTAVFASHMKYSHPDNTKKLDHIFVEDLDPTKKIILEKQKAKLSLFSRYYWQTPLKLPCNVGNSNQTILVLARIINGYKTFLAETDEGHNSKFNLNQDKHWPKEKPRHFPYWEHIKNRIMNNTRSCVKFIKSSLTEPMLLNQDDAKVLFFYGCFQAMIILSTRERYSPEEKTFQYFWNWKIPPNTPAYLFRENLLQAAQDLYNMNIDITESAVMCVLSVVSADWITLRDPEVVEKLRTPVIKAFEEFLSVKYGCETKRGEELMKMMPVLRELTLWHSEMLTNMKLSINTEEMDGLFKILFL